MLIYNYILKIILVFTYSLPPQCFVTVYVILSCSCPVTNECLVPYNATYWYLIYFIYVFYFILFIVYSVDCVRFLFDMFQIHFYIDGGWSSI